MHRRQDGKPSARRAVPRPAAYREKTMTAAPFKPFLLATLGEGQTYTQRSPIDPGLPRMGMTFPIDDPFVLRRAIVPVFTTGTDGIPVGYGAAFQVDGWGHYITADHVSAFYRHPWAALKLAEGDPIPWLDPETTPPAFVLLGSGMVFGTMPIPEGAFAPIVGIQGILAEQSDVMKSLHGHGPDEALIDIAMLHVATPQNGPRTASLPVRIEGWEPSVGETVLAVGFPELAFVRMERDALTAFYNEQMVGAYGAILAVHPNGRGGKDCMAGFEVAADWPPGMSGGPVFNRAGEVVGVVSRSIRADDEHNGVGYAVWLGGNDAFSTLATHLDPTTPGVRGGYAVANMADPDRPELLAFEPTYARAAASTAQSGKTLSVHVTLHRLGTGELRMTRDVCPAESPATSPVLSRVVITSHTDS